MTEGRAHANRSLLARLVQGPAPPLGQHHEEPSRGDGTGRRTSRPEGMGAARLLPGGTCPLVCGHAWSMPHTPRQAAPGRVGGGGDCPPLKS